MLMSLHACRYDLDIQVQASLVTSRISGAVHLYIYKIKLTHKKKKRLGSGRMPHLVGGAMGVTCHCKDPL